MGIYNRTYFCDIIFTQTVGRMEPSDSQAINIFRKTINEFKRPMLTEHYGGGNESEEKTQLGGDVNTQDVELGMNEVKGELHKLYMILTDAIQANGNIPQSEDMTKNVIYRVFEKNGIFPALRANPKLKETLLHFLKLDLLVYPYTLSPNIIDTFIETRNIPITTRVIPNKVIE